MKKHHVIQGAPFGQHLCRGLWHLSKRSSTSSDHFSASECSSQGASDKGPLTHQTGKWALLLVYKYCIQVPSQPVTCQCVSCFGLTLVIKREKKLDPFSIPLGARWNFRTALKFLSSENYLTSQFPSNGKRWKRGNYSKMSQDNVCWRKPVLICRILLLGVSKLTTSKIFSHYFLISKSPSNLKFQMTFEGLTIIMLELWLLKGVNFFSL